KVPVPAEARTGQRMRQFKPDKARGWLALSGAIVIAGAELDLPEVIGHPGGSDGEGGLGELDEAISALVRGEEGIACQFGPAAAGFPDGLTVLHTPTRCREIGGWQSRDRTATGDDPDENCECRKGDDQAGDDECEIRDLKPQMGRSRLAAA